MEHKTTAEWINVGNGAYKCTNCGAVYQKMNYCGNCGFEMSLSSKKGKKKSNKAPRYYAIKKEGFATVVTSWEVCETLVKGEAGVKYKKFATRKEAEAWLKIK